MPKYLHPNVLDNGTQYIVTSAAGNVDMYLISDYLQGESFAVVSSHKVAEIDMAGGDFTLGDQGTLGRKLTVAEKVGTATGDAPSPNDLHIALVDVTNSRVLAVTDETSDQAIASGNPITVPTFDLNMNQPI